MCIRDSDKGKWLVKLYGIVTHTVWLLEANHHKRVYWSIACHCVKMVRLLYRQCVLVYITTYNICVQVWHLVSTFWSFLELHVMYSLDQCLCQWQFSVHRIFVQQQMHKGTRQRPLSLAFRVHEPFIRTTRVHWGKIHDRIRVPLIWCCTCARRFCVLAFDPYPPHIWPRADMIWPGLTFLPVRSTTICLYSAAGTRSKEVFASLQWTIYFLRKSHGYRSQDSRSVWAVILTLAWWACDGRWPLDRWFCVLVVTWQTSAHILNILYWTVHMPVHRRHCCWS